MMFFKLITIIFFAVSCLSSCKKQANSEIATNKANELLELKQKYTELGIKIKSLEKELGINTINSNAKVVSTLMVTADTFAHYIELQGKVEGDNNVNVSAKMPGTITKVYVTKGQRVGAGQVLASMDASVLGAQIDGIRSQLKFAENLYQKQQNLWNQGIGTEVQYLSTKNNVDALRQQIAALQEQNEMYKIKAPISGTVDEVFSKDGEAAMPGYPSFKIVNLSELKVTAMVADAYINTVKSGNIVFVSYPDIDNKVAECKIKAVSNTIDPITRTFNVEIRPSDTKDLKPNMVAKIKIRDYINNNVISLPLNSVISGEDGKYVFILSQDDTSSKAEKRSVKVGQVSNDIAEILDGLQVGDHVITNGAEDLINGDAIRVQ